MWKTLLKELKNTKFTQNLNDKSRDQTCFSFINIRTQLTWKLTQLAQKLIQLSKILTQQTQKVTQLTQILLDWPYDTPRINETLDLGEFPRNLKNVDLTLFFKTKYRQNFVLEPRITNSNWQSQAFLKASCILGEFWIDSLR